MTFVMFVYRPVENQKKDTLISAFFNNLPNATSISAHAPFKGGRTILSYLTLQFKVFRYSFSKTSDAKIFQTP